MTSVFQEGIFFTQPDARQLGPNIYKIDINQVQCVTLTVTGTAVIAAISAGSATLTNATNQVIIGPGPQTTLNFNTPAANRTYTMPDTGANSSFIMSDGTQTINGSTTFTSPLIVNSITPATPGSGVTLNGVTIKEATLVAPAITLDSIKSSAAPNASVAIIPTGTGALMTQTPDNTAVGGNQRGNNAVDFQMVRAAATQVASGANSFIGSGTNNTVSGAGSGIVAGTTLAISGANSFIGAGSTMATQSNLTFMGSGAFNSITTGCDHSCVVAGINNVINANSTESSILGGSGNTLAGTNVQCVIVGGANHTISAASSQSVILGGTGCTVTGNQSMAFGTAAQATANGAIAFSDSTAAIFTNATANSFGMRFTNGYNLTGGAITAGGGLLLPTAGGTPTNLNYYEEAPYADTTSGGMAVAYNATVTRTGRIVTFQLPVITGTPTVGTGQIIITTSNNFPARFRPPFLMTWKVQLNVNGALANGNLTWDPTVPNSWIIRPDTGTFTIAVAGQGLVAGVSVNYSTV